MIKTVILVSINVIINYLIANLIQKELAFAIRDD